MFNNCGALHPGAYRENRRAIDVLGVVVAGVAEIYPQAMALKYLGPMIIDGFGQLAGAVTRAESGATMG